MNKNTKIIILISLIAVCIAAITTTVYAWFFGGSDKPFVDINAGQIRVTVKENDIALADNIAIDGLTYVHFQNDVINDKTNTFDLIASKLVLDIEVSSDSEPISNLLKITEPSGQTGLLYLIIVEGVNLPSSHILSADYRNHLLPLVGGSTNETIWRTKIAEYNQSKIDYINDLGLSAGDKLKIQLVFWGDYNMLSSANKQNYLNLTPKISLEIVTSSVK